MGAAINRTEFTLVGELSSEGVIVLDHFGTMRRVLRQLVGKKLQVDIKELKYTRSDAQNRWLWGVAYVTISAWHHETTGEKISKEAIHAYVLQNILEYKMKVVNIYGKDVIEFEGKSSSALNVQEFSDLKDKIQAHWAEKGLVIPDPKQNNFLSDFISDD